MRAYPYTPFMCVALIGFFGLVLVISSTFSGAGVELSALPILPLQNLGHSLHIILLYVINSR